MNIFVVFHYCIFLARELNILQICMVVMTTFFVSVAFRERLHIDDLMLVFLMSVCLVQTKKIVNKKFQQTATVIPK